MVTALTIIRKHRIQHLVFAVDCIYMTYMYTQIYLRCCTKSPPPTVNAQYDLSWLRTIHTLPKVRLRVVLAAAQLSTNSCGWLVGGPVVPLLVMLFNKFVLPVVLISSTTLDRTRIPGPVRRITALPHQNSTAW